MVQLRRMWFEEFFPGRGIEKEFLHRDLGTGPHRHRFFLRALIPAQVSFPAGILFFVLAADGHVGDGRYAIKRLSPEA